MDENLNELISLLNSQTLEDNMEKIRTKIYKEIKRLLKDNDEDYFRRLDTEEIHFWYNILRLRTDNNLNNLIKIYECLKILKNNINSFRD